jgi:tRNA nucleotidyltransferase (CCA-adding enzyme)
VDPYGGRADLANARIRFLHPGSPADDPTRAFRAVRYANRLHFRISPEARREIAAALAAGAVDEVSGDRLRRELSLILLEPGRGRAVRALQRLGLAAAVAPELAHPGSGTRVAAAEKIGGEVGNVGWLCYFFAWMGPIGAGALENVADRLAFAGRERRALFAWRDLRASLTAGASRRSPAGISRLLRGRSRDEVLAVAAEWRGAERRRLLRAFAAPWEIRLSIRGSDLVAAGIAPGPGIGRALAATLAAREQGRISPEQELDFAIGLARETREER